MGKIVHFVNCLIKIIKQGIKSTFNKVLFLLKKAYHVIGCIFAIKKSYSVKRPVNTIAEIYPDNGKLSKSIAKYRYKECRYDLSIIIPMFNVENYICTCLDSVVNQKTNYLYEIIIIDDGSTDNTLRMAEAFISNKECNTTILSQENNGQSSARNMGIDCSSGEYLMFLDADDILLPNAVDGLLRAAKQSKSDIAEGSFVRFYDKITKEMICDSKGKNHIESSFYNARFVLSTYGYSWGKVYSRELWRTLRYPEGYIFEDVITKFILRRKANQVTFIDDVVYGYRMNNPSSSSHNAKNMKKLDSVWVLPKVIELCEQENVLRDDVFYLLALNHIGLLNYITTRTFDEEIRVAVFFELRKQLLSLQDCKSPKLPFMFYLLDTSILNNQFEAWEYIAETITRFEMLKKWREVD